MLKIGVQQSTLCYNLNHYNDIQICQQNKNKKGHKDKSHNDRNPNIYHHSTITQRWYI